jgi:RNA polymerase sigma factor (sigma-70 family)
MRPRRQRATSQAPNGSGDPAGTGVEGGVAVSSSRKGPSDADDSMLRPIAPLSAGEGAVALPLGRTLVDHEHEESLVTAAQDGDERALETLYRAHYDTVYRYVLYRLGGPSAAEDVTSQVFLGMVRNLPGFRWRGKPFIAWLYAIAQKQIAYHLRTTSRGGSPVDIEAVAELVADTVTPHATVEERERKVALTRALQTLPDAQREVVLLRFVLALSLAETAASMGKSEGAVKQLQLRALAAMRDVLSGPPA